MAQKIDPKAQQSAAANRIYEDFQPPFDWAREQASDTLIVSLEGFRKEQLRVQITSSRLLRVSGERQIDDKRWRRFHLELNVPQDSDTNEIAARFERGMLYIKFPKLITPSSKPQSVPPSPPPPPPTSQKPPPQQEAAPSKPTRVEEEKAEAEEEEAAQKKPQTTSKMMEQQKEKERSTGEGSDVDDQERKDGKSQNYRDAIVGLIGEVKKQKKIANLVMAILMVLLLVLYVKNSIKSSLGGSKTTQDL